MPQSGSPTNQPPVFRSLEGHMGKAGEVLEIIRTKVERCDRCKNHSDVLLTHRSGTVYRPTQDIMLIGERPGQKAAERMTISPEEYESILRFHPYGRLVHEGIGLSWTRVFYSNFVKCSARGERPPEPDEIEKCAEYLDAQIAAIRPRVLIVCGRTAARSISERSIRVTKEAGQKMSTRYGIPMLPIPNPTGKYYSGVYTHSLREGLKQLATEGEIEYP